MAIAVNVLPPAVSRELEHIKDSRERIKRLREQARFLVDEIYDREAQLDPSPERRCPGCERPAPARRAH